jgi:hypothetical protein
MSNPMRLLTGTCLSLCRVLHASSRPGISRAYFSSGSPVRLRSPLDFDMFPSAPESKSEPSTVPLPKPIRTQLTDPTDSMDKTQTPPSVGPRVYDTSVIPPSHGARTIVLCFDGTGDQFDADVCAISLFTMSSSPIEISIAEFEHRAAVLDAQER